MDDAERELREMLNNRVAAMPAEYDAPPVLLQRARRRRATKLTALAVSVVIVAGGAVGAIAQVGGDDGPRRVITPTPTVARPSVPTITCPVDYPANANAVHLPPPSLAPRTPTAGDPEALSALASFAATDDPRFVVLGPKSWDCQAMSGRPGGGDVMGLISPNSPQSSTIEGWPIAVLNAFLRDVSPNAKLSCLLPEKPPDMQPPDLCGPANSIFGTVTRVNSRLATFVARAGVRGVGWMASASASDANITILTCRPTDELTVEMCDTIIADYIARLEAEPITPARPSVQTVACPMVNEVRAGDPTVVIAAPATTPRVPSAGSPAQLSTLKFTAMNDDPRDIVLGPETWSCHGRITSAPNIGRPYFVFATHSMVVYDPNATPGRVPGLDAAAIAMQSYTLWGDDAGFLLACSLFSVDHGCPTDVSPGRTVTHVGNNVATFVERNGERGAAWMLWPSAAAAGDGTIFVLTCRPSIGLSPEACDTIVADYAARISTVPPDQPDPESTTTTTTQSDTVATVACPMTYATTDHETANPSTAPRVPGSGDPSLFAGLTSYAALDDPRYVALGPSSWSCQGQIAADGDNALVIYQTPGPGGAAPDIFTAPIAIENDYLWHGLSTLGNACSVSTEPAVIAKAAALKWPCAMPAGRSRNRVDGHISTFVDTDGSRGAAALYLPSHARTTSIPGVDATLDDGKLSILTCRPNADLTIDQCNTVIADWIARNDVP